MVVECVEWSLRCQGLMYGSGGCGFVVGSIGGFLVFVDVPSDELCIVIVLIKNTTIK